MRNVSPTLIKIFVVWLAAQLIVITPIGLLNYGKPAGAVILMGASTAVIWIIIGGFLMLKSRDRIKAVARKIPVNWGIKFVVFAAILASLEEAVTVTMTNLAPLFGVPFGKAYITASGNWLDVIAFHSVIFFIPMFICWALILRRYNFSPSSVMILFGITGTLAEASLGGFQQFLEMGFWLFIYGLMIYLPAYSLPDRKARKPPAWLYPIMIFLPVLFVPLAAVINPFIIISPHPPVHFAPMGP